MARLSWVAFALVLVTGMGAVSADPNSPESWFPEKVKDFGTVPRGPMLVHYFRVTNPTSEPIQIGGARVSCGCVTAVVPNPVIPAGGSGVIYAQMDTRRFVGAKSVTVYVTLIKPVFQEVSMQVTAFAREDFMIHPDNLSFGQVARGQPATATARVSFYGDLNWQITEVTSESGLLKPSFKPVPGQNANEVAFEVSAQLGPDAPAGKWFTDVWLKTTNPTAAKIRIPVNMEVVSALTATPTAVQFGGVFTGQKNEQRILLKGNAPFKILKVEGTDDAVQLTSPIGEEAKPVHVLTFTLDAKAAGAVDRKLKVVTDLASEREIVLPATGQVFVAQ